MLTLEEKQVMKTVADLIVSVPYVTKRYFEYIFGDSIESDYDKCAIDDLLDCCSGINSDGQYVNKLEILINEIEDEDVKSIFKTAIEQHNNMLKEGTTCTQKH